VTPARLEFQRRAKRSLKVRIGLYGPFNGHIMIDKNDFRRRSPGNGHGATKKRREEFTPTRSGAGSPLSTGAFRLSLTMTQINVLVDFLRQGARHPRGGAGGLGDAWGRRSPGGPPGTWGRALAQRPAEAGSLARNVSTRA